MKKDKDIVNKPNQTIMITNESITVVQRKAYNVILQKAWQDLRVDKNKTVFSIEIKDLKLKSGIDSKDDDRLKKDIRRLRGIEVEVIRDEKDWSVFGLISDATRKGNILEIELPKSVREELIANNYYTPLDLLIIKTLTSKHAVTLYELALRYHKVQIPELSIEELRKLTGTENKKSYDNFNDFEKRVLTPAIEEINEKTDIILNYTTTKKGKKTAFIKFAVRLNKEQLPQLPEYPEQIDIEYYKINQLARIFTDETGDIFPINKLEELVETKGYDTVLNYFTNAKKFNYDKTPVGFFIKAIEEEYKIPDIKKKETPNTSYIPQKHNHKQRKYSPEYLNSLYENS